MGLFKSFKDLNELGKQGKQLRDQQLSEQGYSTGFKGQMDQMGDMIGQSKEMLSELTDQSGDRERILTEGIAGEGVILGMGVPERGAQWFNLQIDLEVHVSGREPYRVNKQYMVPATAQLGQGVHLPIKVDPNDQAGIAIDWDQAPKPPADGEIRPGGGGEQVASRTAGPAGGFASSGGSPAGDGDSVAQLEKLAKLRDSGALTDAEFEQQKAKILGS